MYALTIKQPWASAIMAGAKRVENRVWSTGYRGPLAIHAGLTLDPEAEDLLEYFLDLCGGVGRGLSTLHSPLCTPHALPQAVEDLPTGAILGVVDLIDVVRLPSPHAKQRTLGRQFEPPDPYGLADDPLATGPWCWILRNPRILPRPIPCRGQQSLWRLSDALADPLHRAAIALTGAVTPLDGLP